MVNTMWQLSPYKTKPKNGSIGHFAFNAQTPGLAVAEWFRLYGNGTNVLVWVGHPGTPDRLFEPKSIWLRYLIEVSQSELRVTVQ